MSILIPSGLKHMLLNYVQKDFPSLSEMGKKSEPGFSIKNKRPILYFKSKDLGKIVLEFPCLPALNTSLLPNLRNYFDNITIEKAYYISKGKKHPFYPPFTAQAKSLQGKKP